MGKLKIFYQALLIVILIISSYTAVVVFYVLPQIDSEVQYLEEKNGREVLSKVIAITKNFYKDLEAYKQDALDSHKQNLKNLTDTVWSLIQVKYRESGGKSRDRFLQEDIIKLISSLTYDKDNYFFIADYNNILLAHPYLQGQDFSHVKDIKGNLIIPPMVQIARSQGQGFHSYWWKKNSPDSQPYKKLTYSKNFPELKIIVGTGVYINDITTQVNRRKEKLMTQLRSIVRETKIGTTGYLYIFNADGKMLIHPNDNIEGTNFKNLENPGKHTKIFDDLVQASQSSGTLYYKWDTPTDKGNYIYEKISWIEFLPELNWYIVSSAYVDDLRDTSRSLANTIFLIGTILLLCGVLVSYFFFRKLLFPVTTLSRLAQKAADGDYSNRADFQKDDEIGILAKSFNRMLDTIEDNIENLDKKVQVKTRELEEQKKKAENATRLKSIFLANMSHEIRTPLNGITGMIYLMSNTGLTSEQKNYLEKISSASTALLRIINDILDLSKIEADRLELEMINFNLYEVIDNVVNIVEYRAREKNLDLIVICDKKVNPYLHGDPLRLGQIIINLVNNGIKFTRQGEVSILVSKTAASKYRFEIRDTGVGLSEKQQQKLFQPFSQADGSTTRKYGGSGLGLAISRQLVELMGGQIWVESSIGRGSSFIFEINLHEQQDNLPTPVTFKDKRILIVDDTPAWRTCLRALLEKYHFHIDEAASGEEAVEKAEAMTSCYDLILMDWKMTGMDGISTTEKINLLHGRRNQATVMMVSAFRQQHLVEAAKKAGIEIFLTKPVTPSVLDNIIFRIFAPDMLKSSEKTKTLTFDTYNNASFSKSSILLVEDNEMNREIVLSLLEKNSIYIDIATNGEEAVNMVKSHKRQHYGLVLMDIQMPVMDGFEASELIKKTDPHLPIVALTANVMTQDIRKIKSSGMDDILEKPLVPDKLFKIILKYLSPTGNQNPTEEKQQSAGEPSLSGHTTLDIKKGLIHFNGNRKLYQKILNDFTVNFGHAGEELRLLQTTDRTAAERLIHTIKGLAGNIGASALYYQAEKLEKEFTHTQVERFIELLNEVIQDITKQSSQEKPSTPDILLSSQEITVLFRELARVLKTERMLKCRPLLEKLENAELTPKDLELVTKINYYLENFDFTSALTALQQREQKP